VYSLKVHEVPDASPSARGKAIINLLAIGQEERVAALMAIKEFDASATCCSRPGAARSRRRS